MGEVALGNTDAFALFDCDQARPRISSTESESVTLSQAAGGHANNQEAEAQVCTHHTRLVALVT